MRNSLFLTLFLSVLAESPLAQVDWVQTAGKLDMTEIRRVRMDRDSRGYILHVDVTFTNAESHGLKLRNGEFDVSFEEQSGRTIAAGKAVAKEIELPAESGGKAGSTVHQFVVYAGPNTESTFIRLMRIMNLIGDPNSKFKMLVNGTSEIGLKLPRGWVFEPGRKFEVNFEFTPAYERKVLLK